MQFIFTQGWVFSPSPPPRREQKNLLHVGLNIRLPSSFFLLLKPPRKMTRETLLATQSHSAAESAQIPIPIPTLGTKSVLPNGRGVSWAAELWLSGHFTPPKARSAVRLGNITVILALTRSFQSPHPTVDHFQKKMAGEHKMNKLHDAFFSVSQKPRLCPHLSSYICNLLYSLQRIHSLSEFTQKYEIEITNLY